MEKAALSLTTTRAMFLFLLPMLLSNITNGISSTLQAIMVGQHLGVEGLAALAAFLPLFYLFMSFLFGFTSGSSVLAAQAYGGGQEQKVKAVTGTGVTSVFFLGWAMALLAYTTVPYLLQVMGTPSHVYADAVATARIAVWCLPPFFLFFLYSALLRGLGDSRTPFFFLLVNVVGITGATAAGLLGWGIPSLGIRSVGWGYVIGDSLAFLSLFLWLRTKGHLLWLKKEDLAFFTPRWDIFSPMLRIGLPTALQNMLVALSEMAILGLVNSFGASATAAFGAYWQVANYIQMPAISLTVAVSVFGAQAVGAGRSQDLGPVVRSGLLLNLVIGGVLVGLAYLLAPVYLPWFLTEKESLTIALRLIWITGWSYLLFGVSGVLTGIMRSTGAVFWPSTISVLVIWLVEVPVAYGLSHLIGIDGIWWGYAAAFTVGLLLIGLYYRYAWQGKTYEALV
ncbi:MAG: MATE family efflux transporter [Bacillota bacterium]|nr:MATE family efflux transporter [Bacillota bacterium]